MTEHKIPKELGDLIIRYDYHMKHKDVKLSDIYRKAILMFEGGRYSQVLIPLLQELEDLYD